MNNVNDVLTARALVRPKGHLVRGEWNRAGVMISHNPARRLATWRDPGSGRGRHAPRPGFLLFTKMGPLAHWPRALWPLAFRLHWAMRTAEVLAPKRRALNRGSPSRRPPERRAFSNLPVSRL